MPKFDGLVRFLGIFLITYLMLVFLHLVPAVRVVHTSIFIFFQEILFNLFHPSVHAKLDLIDRTQFANAEKLDFSMFLYNQQEYMSAMNKAALEPSATLNQDIRVVSQGPFTFLLALIIATPSTWRKRLIAFVIGLILLYTLQTVRYTYLVYENAPLLRTGGTSLWVGLCRNLGPLFRTAEFMTIMMLPVWALVALDREKLKGLYTSS